MEFTFVEVIDALIDAALFGMEAFVGIWLYAAFAASLYPDAVISPTAPVVAAPAQQIEQIAVVEPAKDIETVIGELTYASLRKVLKKSEVKCSGMNKELMATKLLLMVNEGEIDINSLTA